MTKQIHLLDKTGKKYPVTNVRITFPLNARWTAVGTDAAHIVGTNLSRDNNYTLVIDNISFKCSVVDTSNINDTHSWVNLVGGNDGINKFVQTKHLQGPTFKQIVTYLLSQCGETLSPNSDQKILNQRIINSSTYSIVNTTKMWIQLYEITKQFNCNVQFDENGQVLIKSNLEKSKWIIDTTYHRLVNSSDALIRYSVDEFIKIPHPGELDENDRIIQNIILNVDYQGRTLSTSHISYINSYTTFASSQKTTNKSYPATVVAQLPNWKLKVRFDDKNGPMGVSECTDIRIRNGSTLLTQRVKPGTRVSVNYDDSAHPFIESFESKYTSEPLTGDSECLFFGSPSSARGLARKEDAVITYMPSTFSGYITLGAIPTTEGTVIAGTYPISISLTPTPGSTIKLPGLIKTATTKVRSE